MQSHSCRAHLPLHRTLVPSEWKFNLQGATKEPPLHASHVNTHERELAAVFLSLCNHGSLLNEKRTPVPMKRKLRFISSACCPLTQPLDPIRSAVLLFPRLSASEQGLWFQKRSISSPSLFVFLQDCQSKTGVAQLSLFNPHMPPPETNCNACMAIKAPSRLVSSLGSFQLI